MSNNLTAKMLTSKIKLTPWSCSGEDGVVHGIAQTNGAVVVASQELVPTLLKVLPNTPSVHSVVVIPNHKPFSKPESEQVKYP